MLKLQFNTWLKAIKLSTPTVYNCQVCGGIIYNFQRKTYNGMFCYRHSIIGIGNNFESLINIVWEEQNK